MLLSLVPLFTIPTDNWDKLWDYFSRFKIEIKSILTDKKYVAVNWNALFCFIDQKIYLLSNLMKNISSLWVWS
jgi:hypothetical protein